LSPLRFFFSFEFRRSLKNDLKNAILCNFPIFIRYNGWPKVQVLRGASGAHAVPICVAHGTLEITAAVDPQASSP
jgi:hypothetical protein